MNDLEKKELTLEISENVFQKVKEWNITHSRMSDDTRSEFKIFGQKIESLNEDLKGIREDIKSARNWLFMTFVTICVSIFWVGSWKGNVDTRLDNLEKSDVSITKSIETHINQQLQNQERSQK